MTKKYPRRPQRRRLKAVDFFCGAGGVTAGFRMANIKVLGGIDIDETCKDTYEKNNRGAKFIQADVSEFSPKDLQKKLGIKRNDRDLIFVGCSPCQYYTNLKTDKTKSEETRLLLEDFKEFVIYFKPGFIFIENVPGLESNPESPLGKFKSFLKQNDYQFDDDVINAKYFGVPQNRRRYILIASRHKRIKVKLPEGANSNIRTVRQAIGDTAVFPPINAGHKDSSNFKHSSAKLDEINLVRIQRTPANGGNRTAWSSDSTLQLECYKTHDGHTDVYGRMSWDEPSPALTTRFCSLSNGRYGHPEQHRAISLREGATLQSFPLNYNFHVDSQGATARMIGNAVPPVLAMHIGQTIHGYWRKWRNSKHARGR